MGFLNKKTTWSNKELIPLKICIASIYLIVGAKFNDWVSLNTGYLLALFVATLLVSMYLWVTKMRS